MDETMEIRGDEPSTSQVEDETYGFSNDESSSDELPFHIPRD